MRAGLSEHLGVQVGHRCTEGGQAHPLPLLLSPWAGKEQVETTGPA